MKNYLFVLAIVLVSACAPQQYALQSDLNELRARYNNFGNIMVGYVKEVDEVVRAITRTLSAEDFLHVIGKPFFNRFAGTRRLVGEKIEQYKRAGNVNKTTLHLLTEYLLILYASDTSDKLGKEQFCETYQRVVREGHNPGVHGRVTFRITCIEKKNF